MGVCSRPSKGRNHVENLGKIGLGFEQNYRLKFEQILAWVQGLEQYSRVEVSIPNETNGHYQSTFFHKSSKMIILAKHHWYQLTLSHMKIQEPDSQIVWTTVMLLYKICLVMSVFLQLLSLMNFSEGKMLSKYTPLSLIGYPH